MNYDIIKADYVDGYKLRLCFADGRSGVVDCLPFIEKGGVFEVLRDEEKFRRFSLDPDWNTVTWEDGQVDIAPETLYHEATGEWPARKPLSRVAEQSPPYDSSGS